MASPRHPKNGGVERRPYYGSLGLMVLNVANRFESVPDRENSVLHEDQA